MTFSCRAQAVLHRHRFALQAATLLTVAECSASRPTACRRNPSYNASRIVYCVVLSVLLGTVYLWKGQAR